MTVLNKDTVIVKYTIKTCCKHGLSALSEDVRFPNLPCSDPRLSERLWECLSTVFTHLLFILNLKCIIAFIKNCAT